MSILQSFPSLPERGTFTVTENNNVMVNIDDDQNDLILHTAHIEYPVISVKEEIGVELAANERADLIGGERIFEIEIYEEWCKNGVTGVLENLSQIEANNSVSEMFSSMCAYSLRGLNVAIKVRNLVMPRSIPDITQFFSEISANRDWLHSPIRDIAWHRHLPKIAVALMNDRILVYEAITRTSKLQHRLVVTHPSLKMITRIEWADCSSTKLAVGCINGTFVFETALKSRSKEEGAGGGIGDVATEYESTLSCLNQGLAPVSSISCCPTDQVVNSVSPSSGYIQVLHNITNTDDYHWMAGEGLLLVRASPDGRLIAVTSRLTTLCLVSADTHLPIQTFAKLAGTVKCLEWSKDSKNVMFTLMNDSNVYGVSVLATNERGIRTYNMAAVDGPEGHFIGGPIHSMEWDKTNKRMAVMFKGNSKLVAVFNVHFISKLMTYNLLPGGYITCRQDENINLMKFNVNSSDEVMLTLVLDTGNLRYIPLYDSQILGTDLVQPQLIKSTTLYPTLDQFE